MKIFLIIVILFLSLSLVACGQSSDGHDIDGHPISLKAFRGQWVFINYWATFCEPCLTEMPELNAFYHLHQEEAVVLGVSYEALSKEQIRAFAKAHGVEYPMLVDFRAHAEGLPSIEVLPTTLVLSPDGKLWETLVGPQTKIVLEKLANRGSLGGAGR